MPERLAQSPLARLALVLALLLAAAAGTAGPALVQPAAVLADDDDDDGEWDDDDDDGNRDRGKERGGNDGNRGHGNDDDGDDDDNPGRGRGNDDDDDEPIVANPSATAIPANTPAAGLTPVPTPTTSPETGRLRIDAFRCQERPAAGDWSEACRDVDGDAAFELEVLDGPYAGWARRFETRANGVVTLDSVPAGRYALDQVGADWCHAESDRVNTDGDVIIAPGQTTRIWIYTCELFAK